jgi:hypothetical protein
MSAGTTRDTSTFPEHTTDAGRRVARVRGIDRVWYDLEDGKIEGVQPCYSPPVTMVEVSADGRMLGWYAAPNVRLALDECRCVLPEQSCPACRAAAREACGEDIPY